MKEKKDATPENMKEFNQDFPTIEKDKECHLEEREEVYFWVKDINESLKGMGNNDKINMLYNKWFRVQNDGSKDGNLCRDDIQGNAIIIAT